MKKPSKTLNKNIFQAQGSFTDNIKPELSGAKVFSSAIRAGFQNLIEDDIEKTISLDKEFEIQSPYTFIFNVTGDSMIELGIYEGDMVVTKKTCDIQNNDIVIANADGIYTLKIYKKKGDKIWLDAANPSYKPIVPKFKLEIFGKVTAVVRKIS